MNIVFDFCFGNDQCGHHGRCVNNPSGFNCSCYFYTEGLFCKESKLFFFDNLKRIISLIISNSFNDIYSSSHWNFYCWLFLYFKKIWTSKLSILDYQKNYRVIFKIVFFCHNNCSIGFFFYNSYFQKQPITPESMVNDEGRIGIPVEPASPR